MATLAPSRAYIVATAPDAAVSSRDDGGQPAKLAGRFIERGFVPRTRRDFAFLASLFLMLRAGKAAWARW